MTLELMRDDDAGRDGPLRRSAIVMGRDDDAGRDGPLRRSAIVMGRDDDAGRDGPLRRSAIVMGRPALASRLPPWSLFRPDHSPHGNLAARITTPAAAADA
ncbi:MAG: hypothetical protein CK431_27595 [Mycobacterium sp.]|nr:MAG: hypothetical protein CK431_27595 [Mycobacterium sp.]